MKITFYAAILVAVSGLCHAQETNVAKVADAAKAPAPKPDYAAVLTRLNASAVLVEYTPKYDGSTAPGYSLINAIENERVEEFMGWVIASDTVLIRDHGNKPRFVEAIKIALPDGGKIAAREHAVFTKSPMMLLKTETPIPGAVPLVFAAPEPMPQKGLVASYDKMETEWELSLSKFDFGDNFPSFSERRGAFAKSGRNTGVFVSATGEFLGFVFAGETDPAKPLALPPFDDYGPVLIGDINAARKNADALVGNGIHLATLKFRSPRENISSYDRYSYSSGSDDKSTVQYAAALHLAPGRLLVLKALAPKQTALLESVAIRGGDGAGIPAEFSASLENFEALIVEAPGLASAPLAVYAGDLRDLIRKPLIGLKINVFGDLLHAEYDRANIGIMVESFKSRIAADFGDANPTLTFTMQGELATIALKRRKTGRRYYSNPYGFAAAEFAAFTAALPADETDLSNVPLPESDENRIAWFGAVCQNLTDTLAREMKISHLLNPDMRDGYYYGDNINGGAVILFVYPGSPAEKAGFKEGDILLRISAENNAKPYSASMNSRYGNSSYSWPSAENELNKTLTDIGFGKNIRIACIIDGEPKEIAMTVEVSPPIFENAPQFEDKKLGLCVRDLTYEVRHHFKRDADAPGVIVSRVEDGEPAAIADIGTREIITGVNNVPVRNIAEFEAQIKGKQELQFTVRQMDRERIVRINLAAAKKTETAEDDEDDEYEDDDEYDEDDGEEE